MEEHENKARRRRRMPLRAETTALLIVDVQPEYWSECPAIRRDFPRFPDRLKRLIDICRRCRAKIIWARADYRRVHSPWLRQFERLRGGSPDFMIEVPYDPDNLAWEDFATPIDGEIIIPKRSWSSSSGSSLKEILRTSRIDTVLVCGLITSVCVQHSAFGAFEAGYRTLLVADACADRGRARHDAALALYGNYLYELVTSEELENPITGLLPPNTTDRRANRHYTYDDASANPPAGKRRKRYQSRDRQPLQRLCQPYVNSKNVKNCKRKDRHCP